MSKTLSLDDMTQYIQDAVYTETNSNLILRKKFAQSFIARSIWNNRHKFFGTHLMKNDLRFLIHTIKNQDHYPLHTPIAHVICRTPDFESCGVSSLNAAGGFSFDLK